MKAFAHRQKHTMIKIEWNPQTKNLEIIHQIFAHDAEQGLVQLGRLDSPDLSTLRAQAVLALYTKQHFKLSDIAGNNLEPEIVGVENDETYLNVYMEIGLDSPPAGLVISNTFLQDIFSDQVNQVNVKLRNTWHSAVFAKYDVSKKILA